MSPQKRPVRACKMCGQEKPIIGGGMCGVCYNKERRRRFREENRPAPSLSGIGRDGVIPPELLEKVEQHPLPSQVEADMSVIRASAEETVPLLGPDDQPSIGYLRLWNYLRRFDAHFRQQIVGKMLALGMGRLEILAAFMTDEKLRKRYIDTLTNPRLSLERDIKIMSKKQGQIKKKPGVALREYIERLKIFERIALDLAMQEGVPASTCDKMLQKAHDIARDIALLEDAIQVRVGQGDIPTARAARELRGKPTEDESEDADNEEEVEDERRSDGYGLPDVETGRLL